MSTLFRDKFHEEAKGKGGNEEEWTRDEDRRKGREVAQAFDFNSREGVLHDLNGIRWRSDTRKETPEKTRTV